MIKKSRIYYIDSARRQSGTNENFNFFFDIKQDDRFTHVSVMQINIPKSYYSISTEYNSFRINENGIWAALNETLAKY